MRSVRFLVLALACLSPLAYGCAADTADEAAAAPEGTGEQDFTSGRAIKVTEADEGKTLLVKKGQKVVLTLPSNATTGYSWKVTQTNRTFGYPKEKYLAPSPSGPVGAGGMQEFTWETESPMPMLGRHEVTLEYRRSWETGARAEKSFTFAVDIVEELPEPGGDAVQADMDDDGKTIEVPNGKDIVLSLSANPSAGYKWHVASTDRTFGYPEEEIIASENGPVGSGATQKLTWKTSGPLSKLGTHTVKLIYARGPSSEPRYTFTLVVDVR